MYLLNLVVANLSFILLENVLELTVDIYSTWWTGSAACFIYLYGQYVASAGITHAHINITLNRIWAISLPVSYRNHHTKTVAVLICLVSWGWVHGYMMPGLILNVVYYQAPLETAGCQLNLGA